MTQSEHINDNFDGFFKSQPVCHEIIKIVLFENTERNFEYNMR